MLFLEKLHHTLAEKRLKHILANTLCNSFYFITIFCIIFVHSNIFFLCCFCVVILYVTTVLKICDVLLPLRMTLPPPPKNPLRIPLEIS